MRVLLDNCAPRGLTSALPGHIVTECRFLEWDKLVNGELLDAAEAAGFDVFLTSDQNIQHQQNLGRRKIAIVVLGEARWRLIRPHLRRVAAVVETARPGSFIEIPIPGR